MFISWAAVSPLFLVHSYFIPSRFGAPSLPTVTFLSSPLPQSHPHVVTLWQDLENRPSWEVRLHSFPSSPFCVALVSLPTPLTHMQEHQSSRHVPSHAYVVIHPSVCVQMYLHFHPHAFSEPPLAALDLCLLGLVRRHFKGRSPSLPCSCLQQISP